MRKLEDAFLLLPIIPRAFIIFLLETIRDESASVETFKRCAVNLIELDYILKTVTLLCGVQS